MSKAFASGFISIFHSAEDFIRKIEEMNRMGYDHLAIADQRMGIVRGTRPSLDEAAGLKIWKEVLPHVQ